MRTSLLLLRLRKKEWEDLWKWQTALCLPGTSVLTPSLNEKLAGRDGLKAASGEKRALLEEAKLYQDFRTQVNEMKDFMADKRRLVREDSFRDGIGKVKVQAQRHGVLEGEIKANAGQLKALNRTGQQMIQRNHFKAPAIAAELEGMQGSWDNLVSAVKEQGSKLGQAEAQNDYNRMTSDLRGKFDSLTQRQNQLARLFWKIIQYFFDMVVNFRKAWRHQGYN